ncbi:hypothetical protein [Herpetosiphon geysericola]|uniref:Uncharacterized protein n=1 Tax=Herpetosiphon geysericola TaxID=70996 RepID=A0A0N8GT08_9CHLR|nr:hypothetical protein [Herpetosiphon geysericola]KPL90778.1 hypothetical protein SE18_05270 [Herpetosiphon geysericola]
MAAPIIDTQPHPITESTVKDALRRWVDLGHRLEMCYHPATMVQLNRMVDVAYRIWLKRSELFNQWRSWLLNPAIMRMIQRTGLSTTAIPAALAVYRAERLRASTDGDEIMLWQLETTIAKLERLAGVEAKAKRHKKAATVTTSDRRI